MLEYLIRADGVITDVSGDWDAFAQGNGGQGALRSQVIGRSLWDFVAGVDTKSFLNAMFFVARIEERRIVMDYRCDSATERRAFRMTVASVGDGHLSVAHEPRDVRPTTLTNVAAFTPSAKASCCSICLKARLGTTWAEMFGRIPGQDFDVDWTICPDCRDHVAPQVARLVPFAAPQRASQAGVAG